MYWIENSTQALLSICQIYFFKPMFRKSNHKINWKENRNNAKSWICVISKYELFMTLNIIHFSPTHINRVKYCPLTESKRCLQELAAFSCLVLIKDRKA